MEEGTTYVGMDVHKRTRAASPLLPSGPDSRVPRKLEMSGSRAIKDSRAATE